MDINENILLFPETKKLFEANAEIAIDSEFILPDYYPEISRILKCITEVNILSKQKSSNKINIGGQVVITFLYSDALKEFNSYTHIVPFTKSFDTDNIPDNIIINVENRPGYLNPKATAPRKIELHGAVNISVSVDGILRKSISSGTLSKDIFIKTEAVKFTEHSISTEKYFFIENDISVGQRPPIAKILRSNARSEITESKIIGGKSVIKGELSLILLYCPVGMQKPVLVSDKYGFSQIIECENADEESMLSVTSEVVSVELHPKTSLDGDVKTVSFEAKMRIIADIRKNSEANIIKDAFSKKFDINSKSAEICMEHLFGNIEENVSAEKRLDFSGGVIENVYDLWCTVNTDYAGSDGKDILIRGTVTVNIIGLNGDGEPTYAERSIEYEYREESDISGNIVLCKPNVIIVSENYNEVGDGNIDVTIELHISATVITKDCVTVIGEIESTEKSTKILDSETAVILYFAENETVWNIAKTYGCDPDEIIRINGDCSIDDPVNKTLLIPNM